MGGGRFAAGIVDTYKDRLFPGQEPTDLEVHPYKVDTFKNLSQSLVVDTSLTS